MSDITPEARIPPPGSLGDGGNDSWERPHTAADALVERLKAQAEWAAPGLEAESLAAAADRIEALTRHLEASRQEACLMRAAYETVTRSDVHQRIEALTAERDEAVATIRKIDELLGNCSNAETVAVAADAWLLTGAFLSRQAEG